MGLASPSLFVFSPTASVAYWLHLLTDLHGGT